MDQFTPKASGTHSLLRLIILFGILLVIGLIIGVVYIAGMQIKQPEANNAVIAPVINTALPLVPTATPPPPLQIIDVSDWKISTNSAQGISFKYPPTATVKKATVSNMLSATASAAIEVSAPYKSASHSGYIIDIVARDNVQNFSARQIVQNYLKELDKTATTSATLISKRVNKTLKDYKNGFIDGIASHFGTETDSVMVVTVKNKKTYLFRVSNSQGYPTEEGIDILDGLLSTVTFSPFSITSTPIPTKSGQVESGPSPTIIPVNTQKQALGVTATKTYISSDSGYVFTYPSNWTVQSYNAIHPNSPGKYRGNILLENNGLPGTNITANNRVQAQIQLLSLSQLCGVQCQNLTEAEFFDTRDPLWETGSISSDGSGITVDKVYESTLMGKRTMVKIFHPTKAYLSLSPTLLTTSYFVYTGKANDILEIDFTYDTSGSEKDKNITEFYDILSTLTFTK